MKKDLGLSPSVYETLREMAVDYTFRPSEHVDEVLLATQLGVSRTPVREALYRLLSEGLIVFKPKKGFFGRTFGLNQIRDSYQIRSALEALSTKLCCENVSDEDLQELSKFWAEKRPMMKAAPIVDLVGLDEQFHENIALCSGNAELHKMITDMNSRIRYMRLVSFETEDVTDATIADHDAILAALTARDSESACAEMRRHVEQTLGGLSRIVKEGITRIYLPGVE